MKRTLAELKREAREAASTRGHDLMHFSKISARLHEATCSKCKRKVQINTDPTANEIDIGGEPLAVDCDSPRTGENIFVI
jgi:hypothetical protein